MCDNPVPCACILERRASLRGEHIARSDALRAMTARLHSGGAISDAERDLLYAKSEEEWDDAVHIASPHDPLRSLCGKLGRNLADLPDRPDSFSGCWTCLTVADQVSPRARETVPA